MVSRHKRRALTLVELMVVIAILVALVALLAPLLTGQMEGREVREAARQVNAYFQQAQARAKELGRPVGVVIRRAYLSEAALQNPQPGQQEFDFGYQLTLAEEPPPYRGTIADARARVVVGSNNVPNGIAMVSDPGGPFAQFAQPNDQIRFNLRGPKYRIIRVAAATNSDVTAFGSQFQYKVFFEIAGKPPVRFANPNSVPWEVFRRPRTTSATPLELPNGAALVMNLSGVGMDYVSEGLSESNPDGVEAQAYYSDGANPRQKYIGLLEFGRPMQWAYANMPLVIMFSPNGTVERVYRILPKQGQVSDPLFPPKRPQDKIYLFVGKSGVDRWTNLNDGSNLWITIDPQSGAISTAPNILPPGLLASATTPIAKLGAIASSRQIAASGQNMGGQ